MTSHLNNPKMWIGIPTIIIIFANLGLFYAYFLSEPDLSAEFKGGENALVWSYVQSETFQGITAGLLFPIFIFLFEKRFRILEKREEEQRERKREREAKRKEDQYDAIETTRDIWSKLYRHSIVLSNILKSKKEYLDELSLEINDQYGSIFHLKNVLKYRFEGLHPREINMIGKFMEMQTMMNLSVLEYLKEECLEKDNDEREIIRKKNSEIQDSIGIICRETYVYVVPKVLDVLRVSVDLEFERSQEIEKSQDKKPKKHMENNKESLRNELDKKITNEFPNYFTEQTGTGSKLDILKEDLENKLFELWSLSIETDTFEYHYSKILGCLDGDEKIMKDEFEDKKVKKLKDEYLKQVKEFENWSSGKNIKEKESAKSHFYSNYGNSKNLRKAFYDLPPNVLGIADRRQYSRYYLNKFAACYAEDLLRVTLAERVQTEIKFGDRMKKKYEKLKDT